MKVKMECDVSYSVQFDCEVEVPDGIDFDKLTLKEKLAIDEQIKEAALEYDSLLEVDDVDWFVA